MMPSVDYERLEAARSHLASRGIEFEAGLTDSEVSKIEQEFALQFPPDLRWFLQTGIPVSYGLPDWRGPKEPLVWQLDGPGEGICFDIRNRVFWWPQWGERPASDDDAIAIAMQQLSTVPKLIPVFQHVCLPSEPNDAGNPIFSVNQSDVIQRGENLAHYLFWMGHDENDDEIERDYPVFSETYRPIRFWTGLARWNTIECRR